MKFLKLPVFFVLNQNMRFVVFTLCRIQRFEAHVNPEVGDDISFFQNAGP